MECEEEKETVDFEMRFDEETNQEMEVDEVPEPEGSDIKIEEGERDVLEEAKNKRADR